MSKQNLNQLLNKAELLPSQLNMLKPHLPEDFFNEFYRENPSLKNSPKPTTINNFNSAKTGISKQSDYSISIQIDPESFDPEKWDIVAEEVKRMMKRVNERLNEAPQEYL